MQQKWNISIGIDQVKMPTIAQHHKIQWKPFEISVSCDAVKSDDRQTPSVPFNLN